MLVWGTFPADCRNARLVLFFFNDTATTEIYTLSLHDALPISLPRHELHDEVVKAARGADVDRGDQVFVVERGDRKSTRLNSSHSQISYAVFCLKKKPEPGEATRAAKPSVEWVGGGPPSLLFDL